MPGPGRSSDLFLAQVDTGRGQRGIQSFLDQYLDSMFTCGQGVGEIVLDPRGRDIAALLCADPEQVEVKLGDSPLDFRHRREASAQWAVARSAKRPAGAPKGSVCPVGTWAKGPKRPGGVSKYKGCARSARRTPIFASEQIQGLRAASAQNADICEGSETMSAPKGSVSPVGCCAKRKATRRRTAKRAVGAPRALRDD